MLKAIVDKRKCSRTRVRDISKAEVVMQKNCALMHPCLSQFAANQRRKVFLNLVKSANEAVERFVEVIVRKTTSFAR